MKLDPDIDILGNKSNVVEITCIGSHYYRINFFVS